MTVSITLRPSGRVFALEPGETVLESALRAGLNLAHGCTNGTCGECQARVLAGDVREVRFHDYAISEVDKQAGHVLLCSTTADSDVEIEASHTSSVDDVPLQTHRARITRVEHLGPHTVSLHCRIQRGRVMRFLAGQHARVALDGLEPADLPIASCPCDGHYLRFHVQQGAHGSFGQRVFSDLKRSERVRIDGPFGRFVLDEESTRPLTFFAIADGFAPIGSLVEHAISLELPQPMRLYWYAAGHGGHYLHNYCRAWADALDDFTYEALTPQPPGSTLEGGLDTSTDRVTLDAADASAWDYYVAGPAALVARACEALAGRGAPRERIFSDALP